MRLEKRRYPAGVLLDEARLLSRGWAFALLAGGRFALTGSRWFPLVPPGSLSPWEPVIQWTKEGPLWPSLVLLVPPPFFLKGVGTTRRGFLRAFDMTLPDPPI